ncbi:hypothetical protein AYL99_09502 [Fonsecaea erecta]|uniref:Uncharacterized protein n=1 Tax=Fonsecaea erecta TaxID=1367422 RepID=A0A178ZAV5_9EURO|nr:hypothetical protein AYL99_09502 [Fonsecaea erecta]OAP56323.1 hypothetical protein AYL99_09502 [Fonsecaea erecta]
MPFTMQPETAAFPSLREYIQSRLATEIDWEGFEFFMTMFFFYFMVYHLARHGVLSALFAASQNPDTGLQQLGHSVSQYLKTVLQTLQMSGLFLVMAYVLGMPGLAAICGFLLLFAFFQEYCRAVTKARTLATPFLSRGIRQFKDSVDLVALLVQVAVAIYRVCSTTWHFCTSVTKISSWSTIKNTLDPVTRPVLNQLQKPMQFVAALVKTISELLFRLRGGREALRAALEKHAKLAEENARLTAEVKALQILRAPKDKQGIWIQERRAIEAPPTCFQTQALRKAEKDCRAAEKDAKRWRKQWEDCQANIAELEALDDDAEARVRAATAQRDERIRALEAELTAVAASAASKVRAMTAALEAEKAESDKLRSSLKAEETKSGKLESRLGEEVALLTRERDAERALLEKVRTEAAEAERAAADQVREQKDAEISVLKAQMAEATAEAAVVVVATAEIGVQTDLAVEASPAITPVGVEAGTQTECIGLNDQSQNAAFVNLETELLASKKELEKTGKDLEAYKFAWKKTSEDLCSCNGDLQKALKEAAELRSRNHQGGHELQQSKREVAELRELLSHRQQEATNLMQQLHRCNEAAEKQLPATEEVKYWRGRTEALSRDLANLHAENVQAKGSRQEILEKFQVGEKQYYALSQRLEKSEATARDLEKQLKAEREARARDAQAPMINSQVESLQRQVMTKDDEIRGLRREINQQKLDSDAAISTPRSDRVGTSPFPTPSKTPLSKMFENKVREHAEDTKKHAIEKQQLESRIASQAKDLKQLWDTKDQLEQEREKLEAEVKKLREQITDEAMDVAFAREFYEDDKEDIRQAQEEAESWKTQFDEAQASVQNMQLDLQFKEGQVDAARMQADLYKQQAQSRAVHDEPDAPRLHKRSAAEDSPGEQKKNQDTKKKILTARHYRGVLPSTRLHQEHIDRSQQAAQAPQANVFQHLQAPAQLVPPPPQATQTAATAAAAEEDVDESSIVSEEE